MNRLLPLILLVLLVLPLRAEDWTTTDGKTYRNVKVQKIDPDVVTIIHKDGGGAIDLATLPPDLQKRFGYDPVKAQAAAAARAKADLENIKLLQAEKDKMNAWDIAATQAIAKAASAAHTNTTAAPDHPRTDPLQTPGATKDGPRDVDHSDPRTHYTGI